jgi:hypothetical protein
MNGIFCANFATTHLCWSPCQSIWCGPCYVPHHLDNFFHYVPTDAKGFDWCPPEEVVRHQCARDGDHLLCPSQCNLCQFHNFQHRNPLPGDPRDSLLLCCICRSYLDAMWGREPHTVQATLHPAKQMLSQWHVLGLCPAFPAFRPFSVDDSFGLRVAIAMLLKSLEPGRHSGTHQQFETIRKLWAGFSNIFMASRTGVDSLRTFGGDRPKFYFSDSPTHSL